LRAWLRGEERLVLVVGAAVREYIRTLAGCGAAAMGARAPIIAEVLLRCGAMAEVELLQRLS